MSGFLPQPRLVVNTDTALAFYRRIRRDHGAAATRTAGSLKLGLSGNGLFVLLITVEARRWSVILIRSVQCMPTSWYSINHQIDMLGFVKVRRIRISGGEVERERKDRMLAVAEV